MSESQTGEAYRARLEAYRPAFALFRMTWHPGWKVYVDGKAVKTVMLSPGFVGAPVATGSHQVECRYEPGWWKIWMALGGVVAAGADLSWRRSTAITLQKQQWPVNAYDPGIGLPSVS